MSPGFSMNWTEPLISTLTTITAYTDTVTDYIIGTITYFIKNFKFLLENLIILENVDTSGSHRGLVSSMLAY